jgi:hypothetical protein
MQLNGNFLILGDSFCQHIKYWPTYLGDQLGYSPGNRITHGIIGASWWKTREYLVDYLPHDKKFFRNLDLMVLIHPSGTRPMTLNTQISGQTPLDLPRHFDNQQFTDEELAVSLYYKYICDPEQRRWTERRWFEELAGMIQNFRTVHLFTDSQSLEFAHLLPGVKVPTLLTDLALLNIKRGQQSLINDEQYGFANHFSLAHNRVFAAQLHDIIQGSATDFDHSLFCQ